MFRHASTLRVIAVLLVIGLIAGLATVCVN